MEGRKLEVQFITNEVIDGHAQYLMKIKQGEDTWLMHTRYSTLNGIHHELKHLNNSLPKFPGKKLFGNLKETFLSKRQKALEHYVASLLKHQNKYKLGPLIKYFKSGKTVNTNSVTSMNTNPGRTPENSKPKDEYEEIYKNFTKTLIQIPKKNNFWPEDEEKNKKPNRLILDPKLILEKKKLSCFQKQEEGAEDAAVCEGLDSILDGTINDLNELIKMEIKPLPRNQEFVAVIRKVE